MKRFKNYLTEKHGYNTHDYYSENPAANGFASPEVQRKINAVLGKICQANYILCQKKQSQRLDIL